MSEQSDNARFTVSVYEPEGVEGVHIFTFVPNPPQENRVPNGSARPTPRYQGSMGVPHYVVAVRQQTDRLAFDWSASGPNISEADREEMQAEVSARMKDRAAWIDRVTSLVGQVEQWAREMGWSTRRVAKKLEDARIGMHRVPALLMQEDTCRFLLEPVGRSTHGAEGVVDLYLMPAYDDIASLYFYGNRWHLHYPFPGDKPASTVREAQAMPLSKETLAKVIAEMRQNAA